jgi:glycine hydroxymethyltransferase
LPYNNQNDRDNPSGLRIGFQDITRRGFREGDVKHLCDLMLGIIKGKRKPSETKEDVIALKKEFNQVKYGFQNVEEAISYIEKTQ